MNEKNTGINLIICCINYVFIMISDMCVSAQVGKFEHIGKVVI